MTSRSKIKEERIELAKQVIEYLNEQADRKFHYDSRGTLKLFTAEWSHRYGFAQYKGVIDYLVLRWRSDEKMAAYLRPATLFGPEKFPEYLDEARARIVDERKRSRLKPFSDYRPVETVDDKTRTPFEKYDPNT
jgi:uncharacterized phage protein (TIGR02220 family)